MSHRHGLPEASTDDRRPGSGTPELSVVVPAYNERDRLDHTLDTVVAHLDAPDAGGTAGRSSSWTTGPPTAAGLVIARQDPRIRRAGALVLAPQPNAGALRETVSKLVGSPGRWVDGVWVWDLHGPGRP
ncbi:hypothetical protein [Streptomyces nigra]|uniref:hypothetical protein n=1 Tax=Streptomyces nigra TaxID=1827580 RepID=UPI0034257ABC